jgi:hypothetical protein
MEKEKRRLIISWRVFTKIDIRRLAQFLFNEYQVANKKKHHSSIIFRLNCQEGISYESDSVRILDDGGPIDLKKTESIQMTFYDYEFERNIDISLKEGDYAGELSIRGTDKNWVQGNFTTLVEIINSIKPQDNVILKYKKYFFHIIAFGVGSLILLLLNLLILRHIPSEPIQISSKTLFAFIEFIQRNTWLAYLIVAFLIWGEGIITFAYPIYKWLLDLWPNIEFDFGPEHLNNQKKRRKRIWFVTTLVIIPIVLNIITNIIK